MKSKGIVEGRQLIN